MPSATIKVAEDCKDVHETDPFRKISRGLERKIRNLERRKFKLEKYREELEKGSELDPDQSKAVEAYDTVVASVNLCQEIGTQLSNAIQENDKLQKALHKKKLDERSHHDSERIKQVLKLMDVITRLKNDKIREDFANGTNGAVQIPEERLDQISNLPSFVFLPTGEDRSKSNAGLKEQLSRCAENMGFYLDGKNKPVMNTTYREMRMAVLKIANTNYPKYDKKSNTTSPTPMSDDQNKIEVKEQIVETLPEQSPIADVTTQMEVLNVVEPFVQENGDVLDHEQIEPAMPHSFTVPTMDVNELVSGTFDFLQESQVDRQEGIYIDPAVMSFGTVKPESLVHMHEQQKLILPSHPSPYEVQIKPNSPPSQPNDIEKPDQPSWTGNEKPVRSEMVWNMRQEESMNWNEPEEDRGFRGRGRRGNYRGHGNLMYSNSKMSNGGYRGRGNGYRGNRPGRGNGRGYGRGRGAYGKNTENVS